MADQTERDEQQTGRSASASQSDTSQTGDPGRTPGTAEGDEQTIEEDLREKEREQGQK